jgi:hypothetical protein
MATISIAHPLPRATRELSPPLAYDGTFRGEDGWFLRDWDHGVFFVSGTWSVQALDRSDVVRGWHAPDPLDAHNTHTLLRRVRQVTDCTVALARQWA